MEKYLSNDNELPFFEKITMNVYFWLKEISLSEERGFGLDPGFVTVEKFPLIVSPVPAIPLRRVFTEEEE
jgi:KUP system potassium uptake protein